MKLKLIATHYPGRNIRGVDMQDCVGFKLYDKDTDEELINCPTMPADLFANMFPGTIDALSRYGRIVAIVDMRCSLAKG